MGQEDEAYSRQFFAWETRGRGWNVFEHPVALEPPFRPFLGHFVKRRISRDEGRKHSLTSGLLNFFRRTIAPDIMPEVEEPVEPHPQPRQGQAVVELQLSLPHSRSVSSPRMETFLRQVVRGGEPMAFELLGTEEEIVPQFIAESKAISRIQNALTTSLPGIVSTSGGKPSVSGGMLGRAWDKGEDECTIVELGLAREFMLPLGGGRNDLLEAVAASLNGLGKGEMGLFQVLFEPVQSPWAESIQRSVVDSHGRAFFVDRIDLNAGVKAKLATPLFGVVIRLASAAGQLERSWEIIAGMASALSALSRPNSNYLIPLSEDGYPPHLHEEDMMYRVSRRSGMLLSMDELIPLVTPPTSAIAPRLRRELKRTKAPPEILSAPGIHLGTNTHEGNAVDVHLLPDHRVRHMHVIGASGTGKSTLFLNLIQQDVEAGEGIAVFDPHGDLIDAVLGRIPTRRIDDTILLDPSDEEFPVGFNILAAHSDFEKSLLASDLTSIFRRLSTSWGDQMESVLRNAILAFLESSRGGTLIDLRRFLIDATFRKDFLTTVTDPEVVYYWQQAFPQLTGGKSVGPVLTRLDEFLARKPLRYMVAQDANTLDFSEILDRRKILLVRLPQGLIGRENTALLGSLVTAKLQMAAMSRQRLAASERKDFWVYMDEFQHFITPSMAEILAGTRKYRMGLILAHQELRQLDADRDVASAVLTNCFTRAAFKVGDSDARTLSDGFAHFEARDLMNLSIGEAICRVERSEFDFNIKVPPLPTFDEAKAEPTRQAVREASRKKYARPRAEVEEELRKKWAPTPPLDPKPARPRQPPQPLEQNPPYPTDASPPPPIPASPVSENKAAPSPQPAAPPPLLESTIRTEPPKDLGRGGEQHKAIQKRIKETAESLGFRAIIEGPTADGRGSADLSLERDSLKIACEISISTSIEHEVGNVRKCAKSGFQVIAVICVGSARLEKIEAAVENVLGEEISKLTQYFLPDNFLAYLETVPKAELPKPAEERRRGYKIKSINVNLAPKDSQLRRQGFLEIIAKSLRQS